MLSSLNTSLVSMGYKPVDIVINGDYNLWYKKALENAVPVDVLDALFSSLNISSSKGLMQLTKELAVDEGGYVQSNSKFIQNDNGEYLNKFINYHYDKAIAVGATSVKLIEGHVFYDFGDTSLKETSIPIGISGFSRGDVTRKTVTPEMEMELVELSEVVLSSSRPLVLITGSQVDLRADYLSKLLTSQGSPSIIRYLHQSDELFQDLPSKGYLIVKTTIKSLSDVLAKYVKGDKEKADRLAHVFSASSGQVDIPAVCPKCRLICKNKAITVPERGFTMSSCQGVVRNPAGCNDCFKGYVGIAHAVELLHSRTQKLIDAISSVGIKELNKSEVSSVHTKFTSDGLGTLYNEGSKLISNGLVSFEDAKSNLL